MREIKELKLGLLILCVLSCSLSDAQAADVGPSNGYLVIVGGAMQDPAIFGRFLNLAGGLDAPIVIIPTAGGGENYNQYWRGLRRYKEAGAKNITLLHTRDRAVADSEEFVRPIQKARGVFFTGGRQWRLADSFTGPWRCDRRIFRRSHYPGLVSGERGY